MRRITVRRDTSRPAWRFLILVVALTAAACGDVEISPTVPSFPLSGESGAGIRTVQIAGSLTAEQGTGLEATVLFDGKELPEARVVCPDAAGCTRLDLAAVTTSSSGRHTISFQVLSQSLDVVVYLAEVTVRVTREGLPFVLRLSPDPIRATLRAGESVTFEFNFVD